MIYRILKLYFVLGRHLISDASEKTSEFLLSTVLYIQRFSTEMCHFKCIAHSIETEQLLLLRKIACLLYLS